MKSVLIKRARIIDPSQGMDRVADVFIRDGRIENIAENSIDPKSIIDPENILGPENIIDADGQILCPGFIDIHVHLCEPGQSQKGTIASESRAAAGSGFTKLVCSPNTIPVIDSPAIVSLIQDKAKEAGYCQVFPLGALTQGLAGEQLSEMYALKEAGCIGVSNGRRPVKSMALLRALEYAATHNLTVFLRPEDSSLSDNGCVHEGYMATRLGLQGVSRESETVALTRDLLLVQRTGVKAHFSNISCAESVELIANAQQRGLPVTAGTSIHHLHLTDSSIDGYNVQCHVSPPFRSEEDLVALRQGVADGIISVICSDHHSHETAAKMAPFAVTEPGISSLDSFLPLGLLLVEHNIFSMEQFITAITHGPAQVIDQPLGKIKRGEIADLCLFSPRREWILEPSTMLSQGHNTPFLFQKLTGKVTATWLSGKLVYQFP
ncbi:MAG: dihydroorotase [Pseudomonadales bacterium]|nr:dihydroorotase [Pseudomonadales bacterium]